MDQGIHEVRLLVTAGDADDVLKSLTGLADWLSAPPSVYSHLPIGAKMSLSDEFLRLEPRNIRLLATKQSEDGKALIIRLQEVVGSASKARLSLGKDMANQSFSFKPFEIKTIRVAKSGKCREVGLIGEH